jgi:IS5 family transposase
MEVVADRLSIRWFLGYDLTEPLPDHSSLTRIRDRYGLEVRGLSEVFRRDRGEMCTQAGLVWGEEFYFDATKVEANASLENRSRPASPSNNTSRISSRKTHKTQTIPCPTRREPRSPKRSRSASHLRRYGAHLRQRCQKRVDLQSWAPR